MNEKEVLTFYLFFFLFAEYDVFFQLIISD